METDDLKQFIRDWVKVDNEIRHLQKEQNIRKVEKKRLNTRLMEIMKNNKIDFFDLNDGEIIYKTKNVKKPITQKTLLNILSSFFEGDMGKVGELNKYILENREIVVNESIIRKVND
jgi:hypothetical protein